MVEIDYTVPNQFNSTKQQLESEDLPDYKRKSLENLVRSMEEAFDLPVVDILASKEDSKDTYGVVISFAPVSSDDQSTIDFFDDAYRWMEEFASNLADPVKQHRRILKPADSFGFDRMDVDNAYGSSGIFASFLTREESGHNLLLIINSDVDPHLPQFDEVILSLRVVPIRRLEME